MTSTSDFKDQLKALDLAQLKMDNGKTLEQELARHADILADCIRYELQKVYISYGPIEYKRTFKLLHSIKVDVSPKISTSGNKFGLSVRVYFDSGSIHTGLDGKPADIEVLLNEGYQTHGAFKDVPFFGYRDATLFIDKGIALYQRTVKTPFFVRLNIAGKTRTFN